jgi:tyrosyl-tRNA synthetase
MLNNDIWLKDLNYLDFLRDFGKHFSINRMLKFDSVKIRLDREQNLSFLEFNYMILQSYDFYILNKKHECRLQIGGSDQWGNIVNGVDLTRRIAVINQDNSKVREAFGLTTPLLTTSDGKKMGKTADGAVWLDENMLSPFDYFQYFRNVSDLDVERFTKYFTDVKFDAGKNINESKEILAFGAVKICHGEKIAGEVLQKAREIFVSKNTAAYEPRELAIDLVVLKEGKKLTEIIKELGILESSSEAKRMIEGGAVKINDSQIKDTNYKLHTIGEFNLAVGKKKFFRINIINS